MIGGACPNTNCLPSKNKIWSAKVDDLAAHGDRFGSMVGSFRIDMARVLARKTAMVDELIAIQSFLDERRRADHGESPPDRAQHIVGGAE